MLEVSFFGPFYSDYNVIALDPDYQYALVTGKNTSYLWILSRTKTIPDSIKQQYLQQAQSLGFKTEELVWTVQN
jgi:apolipoprotein D and lipocalin family protein